MTRYSTPPIALSIAGSDPSGGAGIQADLKTFSAFGVYGMMVVTAITAQNSHGLTELYPLPVALVLSQLESLLADFDIQAIKIGMIGSGEIAEMLLEHLKDSDKPIILDPVVAASRDLRTSATQSLMFAPIIPISYLLTPNIPEAEMLTGITIDSTDAMHLAGEMLLGMGASNVLVKGGHMDIGSATDILVTSTESFRFTSERIESRNTHGTGCTLSSAITALLARGESLPEAVRFAKEYVLGAMQGSREWEIGSGNGPLDHNFKVFPHNRERISGDAIEHRNAVPFVAR